jgi:hypothetical protein
LKIFALKDFFLLPSSFFLLHSSTSEQLPTIN